MTVVIAVSESPVLVFAGLFQLEQLLMAPSLTPDQIFFSSEYRLKKDRNIFFKTLWQI